VEQPYLFQAISKPETWTKGPSSQWPLELPPAPPRDGPQPAVEDPEIDTR